MDEKFNNYSGKDKGVPSKPRLFDTLFRVFVVTFMLFLLHRGLTHSYLSEAVPADSGLTAFFVGALSDCWIGFLMATLVTIVSFSANLAHPSAGRWCQVVFLTILTIGLCAHQGYVEFFRFQIEPFHVSYLSDWQFLSSNATSFPTWSNLLLMGWAAVTALIVFYRRHWIRTEKSNLVLFLCLTATALVAHNRNIHLRVQWFIPDNLQTNLFETVYLRAKRLDLSKRPSSDDFQAAVLYYGATGHGPDKYDQTIFSGSVSSVENLHPLAQVLKDTFKTNVTQGKSPIILIVLLESLRPSETGLFAPEKPTLTPVMDRLATRGIWFKNAYATGSVTRSGQEASLCGNFSGRNTSLMRNFDAVPYNCLTDEMSQKNVRLFWYHGGDGRFDNQESFWRRHQIKDLMTKVSFPENTPRTGWGVSDKAFFKAAATRLKENYQRESKPSFSVGMMLSLTNHIPWTLPADFSGNTSALEPSFLTTTYTDESVGVLETDMKASGLWDSALIFIVSDHGNKTTPYVSLYEQNPQRNQALQSHINLIMTGGLTEHAVDFLDTKGLTFEHFVSQADIATTIAFIVEVTGFRSMGKNLFAKQSPFPILSQTEEGLYIPDTNQLITYAEAAKQLPPPGSNDWLYRFHFKAATEFLVELKSSLR